MARHKDANISLPESKNNVRDWDSIKVGMLMDIRDELKRLNEVLHCHNTLMIPHTLKRIDRRLAKHAPLVTRKEKQ